MLSIIFVDTGYQLRLSLLVKYSLNCAQLIFNFASVFHTTVSQFDKRRMELLIYIIHATILNGHLESLNIVLCIFRMKNFCKPRIFLFQLVIEI